MPTLQEWIHKFEEGEGAKYIKWTVVILALLGLATLYDFREFRNMSVPEGMDAAQVARNISEGKGFTTDYIRPFSMHLVQKHRPDHDPLIRRPHPDLANPPVYPLMLAALMKVLPFKFAIADQYKESGDPFYRNQPDFIITLFNQVWLFAAIALVFLIGKRLFDPPVAWFSAAVLAGTDLLWRFSISGLPSLFLMVLILGLTWCLMRLEQGTREDGHSAWWFFFWAVAAGGIVGIGALTRYAFGWLILPVLAFLAFFLGQRRSITISAALIVFLLLMAPWIARNYQVSGTPFGIPGFAVFQDETGQFPGNTLERSLQPNLGPSGYFSTDDLTRKFLVNTSAIFQNDLPKIGGSWIFAFFLAGLLVPFRNPTLSRLRIFLISCLLLFTVVQAMGKTHLSAASPEINSENLLALLFPLVLVYGAGMFQLLLDQAPLPFVQARPLLAFGVGLWACIPLIYTLLPPKTFTIAYPPYYPPLVQNISGFMKEDELMMSDMPWAVAWYGRRQSVWLTLDPKDVFTINDYHKPIQAVYLSPLTIDVRFLSQMVKGEYKPWGKFLLQCMLTSSVPKGFPLQEMWSDVLPDHVFMSDRPRWIKVGG